LEIIAVYSENHTKHINTLCGQNAELLIVEACGAYSYHLVLKDYNTIHQFACKDWRNKKQQSLPLNSDDRRTDMER
jgi:hypothetical protein